MALATCLLYRIEGLHELLMRSDFQFLWLIQDFICEVAQNTWKSALELRPSRGVAKLVKAPDFDSGMRRFESFFPCQKKTKASIAQAVEAFVFPALVRRLCGSVSWVLKQKKAPEKALF